MKTLVARCADKSEMVDTSTLRSLVNQVFLRVKMLEIEARVSDLDLGKTPAEIMDDCLYDLAQTNPNGVESML